MTDDRYSLKLDPDSLTLGDLADFEDVVGRSVDDVLTPRPLLNDDGSKRLDERGRPVTGVRIPAKALIALVWLANRRTSPDFTLADAREVRVDQLDLPAGDEEKASEGNG